MCTPVSLIPLSPSQTPKHPPLVLTRIQLKVLSDELVQPTIANALKWVKNRFQLKTSSREDLVVKLFFKALKDRDISQVINTKHQGKMTSIVHREIMGFLHPYQKAADLTCLWRELLKNGPKELQLAMSAVRLQKVPAKRCIQIRKFFDQYQHLLDSCQHLDLSNRRMNTLPREIGRLHNLKILDLRGNHLKSLPKEMASLVSLTSLNASSNLLTSVPMEIGHLSLLETLDLSRNFLTRLPHEIGRLTQLKVLDVNHNELKRLPPSLCDLVNLETLNISNNRLVKLPEELHRLTNLVKLSAAVNKLLQLPPSIDDLQNVQWIDVSENSIHELPPEIGRLRNLQILNVSSNALCAIPESIGEIASLVILQLTNNLIQDLPASIGDLRQLEILALDQNRLVALPKSIGKLPHLSQLFLSQNRLFALPEEIAQIATLRVLSAAQNFIQTLPSDLGHLQNLEILILDFNFLEQLPPSLATLRNLTELHVNHNQLLEIPAELTEGPIPTHVSFRHNPCIEIKRVDGAAAAFEETYTAMGEDKWKEGIDGQHHSYGPFVYDSGLHGKHIENGYLKSMLATYAYLKEHPTRPFDEEFYLEVHQRLCAHFDPPSTDTNISAKQAGKFRGAHALLSARFAAPKYPLSEGGLREFHALSNRLKAFFGPSFTLGEFEPRGSGIYILHYSPMPQWQVSVAFNLFVTWFEKKMHSEASDDERLEAIAELIQNLEWLHTVHDGCGRTDIAFLNFLLTRHGLNPVLLEYPYLSSCSSKEEWIAYLREGMQKWREEVEKKQLSTAQNGI